MSYETIYVSYKMKERYTHHSGDLVHALQVLNNFGFVSGLHTGEEASLSASVALLGDGQVIELAARVRFVSGVLILTEHTNTSEKYLLISTHVKNT